MKIKKLKKYEFWLDTGKIEKRLTFRTRAEAERARRKYYKLGKGVTRIKKIGKRNYAKKALKTASKAGGKIVKFGMNVNRNLGGGFG